MEQKLLIDPRNDTVIATLTTYEDGTKNVDIHAIWLKECVNAHGITVNRELPNGFCYLYPTDDPTRFATAFEKCLYPHGLAQKGCYWISADQYSPQQKTIEELAAEIIEAMRPK